MATWKRIRKTEIQKLGSWRFPAQNGSALGAGRGLGRAHAWAERRRSEPPWLKVVFAATHQRAGGELCADGADADFAQDVWREEVGENRIVQHFSCHAGRWWPIWTAAIGSSESRGRKF